MGVRRVLWRGGGVLAAALVLLTPLGCSRSLTGADSIGQAIGNYFVDRATDFLDLGDFGLSITTTPQIGLYANGVSLGGGGYAMIDGYLAGMGHGNVGWMRFYTADVGIVVWAYEELAFGEFDRTDLTTVNTQGTCVGGLLTGPWGFPGWVPACIHYVHLGWVGFVGNINYFEMMDLATGFMGIDLCGDDGRRTGLWPWETGEREASAYAEKLHTDILGLALKPEKVDSPPYTGAFWGRAKHPAPEAAPAPPAAKKEKKPEEK